MNDALPTPLTDNTDHWFVDRDPSGLIGTDTVPASFARELERDCMTLALRLYAMDTDANAPETNEVLERWRPRVEALLKESA